MLIDMRAPAARVLESDLSTTTTIRHMVPADAEAVSALLRDSWRATHGPLMGEARALETSAKWHAPERLAAEAADPDIIAFVAQAADGAICGHAMAQMDEHRQAWLKRLYIAPARFGTGLAEDLLHAVLAAHSGLPSIALEVADGNHRAIAFYRKHGFAETARKADCGGVDVPTLVMTKVLPRA